MLAGLTDSGDIAMVQDAVLSRCGVADDTLARHRSAEQLLTHDASNPGDSKRVNSARPVLVGRGFRAA